MRPYIYLILFLLILGLPFLLRSALTSAPAQHASARIVVVTPENPDAFIQALTAGSPLAYKDTHESTRRHAQGSPNHQAE